MAQWLDARVVQRTDWNDHLFSLRFQCPGFPSFKAGQFTKIGIETEDGKILSRPYSLVNPEHVDYLEIIAVPVEQGSLSPQLHLLQVGDSLKVMTPATGFLVLDEVPDAQTLFLMATGTGVGPFLSILQGDAVWNQYANIVLVYAARYGQDLAYQSLIESLQTQHPLQFHYVPIISRETKEGCLQGRIPQLLADHAIQQHCQHPISPHTCQVMLCGNPQMIQDTHLVLENLGLKKHLRRSPGQISVERYW